MYNFLNFYVKYTFSSVYYLSYFIFLNLCM